MPKVIQKPTLNYRTAPWPEETHGAGRRELLNLQTCSCGHDRLAHSCFVNEGAAREVIVDAPHVGRCCVNGCKCSTFIYDEKRTSPEGQKRYKEEKSRYKTVPPKK